MTLSSLELSFTAWPARTLMISLSWATEHQVLERLAAVLQIRVQTMHPCVALFAKAGSVALAMTPPA